MVTSLGSATSLPCFAHLQQCELRRADDSLEAFAERSALAIPLHDSTIGMSYNSSMKMTTTASWRYQLARILRENVGQRLDRRARARKRTDHNVLRVKGLFQLPQNFDGC